MIISASRRTDIPAFYSEWFLNRLGKEVVVVNPFNSKQANAIPLNKESVDCIVFWTKNARPLLDRIDELAGYNYYFQFTVNGYGKTIEPGVPELSDVIGTFQELSEKIGKEKVIWRYDPIFIDDGHDVGWHISNFKKIADELSDYTEKCVFSFIDMYAKTRRNTSRYGIREPTKEEMESIACQLSRVASEHKIGLCTCCEAIDLDRYGIKHNRCIDGELIRRLFNIMVDDVRDAQRENCGCLKCHDIGVYNTCLHKCRYCYATFNPDMADVNSEKNHLDSPLMIGYLDEDVKLYPIKVEKGKKVPKPFF